MNDDELAQKKEREAISKAYQKRREREIAEEYEYRIRCAAWASGPTDKSMYPKLYKQG